MDSKRANWLYELHANSLAYVDVEDSHGDRSIGTAFHVGSGVFITARHVVQDKVIREVRVSEPVGIRASAWNPDLPPEAIAKWDATIAEVLGRAPLYKHWTEPLDVAAGPLLHPAPEVDVAAFQVSNLHAAVGTVLLGAHWDDWVYRGNWHLNEALVMGYPPIPMTLEPHLVGVRAEINTVVVTRPSHALHFVLSATPRGGFSGGPAIHEDGYALGVVTSSLLSIDLPVETGFMAVLSVEPIRQLLQSVDLMPPVQVAYHDTLVDALGKGESSPDITLAFRRSLQRQA